MTAPSLKQNIDKIQAIVDSKSSSDAKNREIINEIIEAMRDRVRAFFAASKINMTDEMIKFVDDNYHSDRLSLHRLDHAGQPSLADRIAREGKAAQVKRRDPSSK